MFYFVKTPLWLQKIFADCVWNIKTRDKVIYLTFDDGPHPQETEFVLNELKKFGAKATFFCIGANVVSHPAMFQKILDEGHSVGNHTFTHPDGWKIKNKRYYEEIKKTGEVIPSKLFRPPYGHITPLQMMHLKNAGNKIVMWSIISGDFDQSISPQKCLRNVVENIKPGCIIVFHDSMKASQNMRYALPGVLEMFSKKGFRFESISEAALR